MSEPATTPHSGASAYAAMRALRADQVLGLLATLGAAAPEQLVAAHMGSVPAAVPTSTILQIDVVVTRLADAGLVAVSDARCPRGVLRSGDRMAWRRTEAGARAALTAPRAHAKTLAALGSLGEGTWGGWVDESDLHTARYPAVVDRAGVRHRLRQLEQWGWLVSHRTRIPGRVRVLTVTDPGLRYLAHEARRRGRSPTAPAAAPSGQSVIHHLLTVAAALQLTAERGGRIVRVLGDVELRRQVRAGRLTQAGDAMTPIPDAAVVYRPASPTRTGETVTQQLEVLVSGYTTSDLRAKYDAAFAADTAFYAVTARLRERVARLGFPRPTLLATTPTGAHHDIRRIERAPPSAERTERTERRSARSHRATARQPRHGTMAAVTDLLATHGVATIAQVALALGHAGRSGQSYAAAVLRRLARRGIVRTVRIAPPRGRASTLAAMLSADIPPTADHMTAEPTARFAIGRGGAVGLSDRRRLLEYLHRTETRLVCERGGWHMLADGDQPGTWRAYVRARATSLGASEESRARWRDLRTADVTLSTPAPVLSDGTPLGVRVLLLASELRDVLPRIGASSVIPLVGVLPIELVSASPAAHATATRLLMAWAKDQRIAVDVSAVPHPAGALSPTPIP